MRCPHCASPRASPPVCLSCGLAIDAPPEQPVVPGLEPTSAAPVPPPVPETMPGLEATCLEVGEVPLTTVTDVLPTRSPVGEVTAERLPDLETHEEDRVHPRDEGAPPPAVCSECGVPNPATSTKCLSCGKRL